MLRYAWRTLFAGKVRMVLSIGGVAVALVLIIALDAVFLGAERQSTRYIDHAGADLIVSQAGVRTMHMAASTLPADMTAQVAAVDGVETVTPVLFASDILRFGTARSGAYVLGLPPDAASGFPPKLTAGSALPRSGGAVVDARTAERAGLDLGDTVLIFGRPFRIDGLSSGTAGLANSVAIIPLVDFAALQGSANTISFVFVTLSPQANAPEMANRLQSSIAGTTVQTRAQFAAEERSLIRDMGTNVIAVMNVLGFLVGLSVLSLTVYLAALARRSEFGVLKAVGSPNSQLYLVVLVQSIASVFMGFAAAVIFTLTLARGLSWSGSDVSLALGTASLGKVLLASLVIAALAAILPIKRISGLDPATVFRGG